VSGCLQIDLGLIGYAEAWELQKRVVAARKAGAIEDVLLLLRASACDYLGAEREAQESAGQ